jgi:hypothetical protein
MQGKHRNELGFYVARMTLPMTFGVPWKAVRHELVESNS